MSSIMSCCLCLSYPMKDSPKQVQTRYSSFSDRAGPEESTMVDSSGQGFSRQSSYFEASHHDSDTKKSRANSDSDIIVTAKHFAAFENFCSKHSELNTYGRGDPSKTLPFYKAVRANSKNWEADTEAAIQKRPKNAELLRQVSKTSLISFTQPYSKDFHETREEHYKRMCVEFFKLLNIDEKNIPILINNKLNPIIGVKLMKMESKLVRSPTF